MKAEEIEKINIDDLKGLEEQAKALSSQVASDLGVKGKPDDKLVLMEVVDNKENETLEVKVKVPRLLYGGWKDYLTDNVRDSLIMILFVVFSLLNVMHMISFGLAVESLNIRHTALNNLFYELIVSLAPLVIWAVSTNHAYFNFRNIKLTMFHLSFFFVNFLVIRFVYVISYDIFVPLIGGIKVTEEMTAAKIIGLAYIATFIPTILVSILLFYIATKWTSLSKEFIKLIENFRLFKVFDPALRSKHEYVFKAVKNIEDGETIIIDQKDRQMHTAIIGATGTAKTSSVLLPSILSDLKVRTTNKEALKKAMRHYVEKGLFIITRPFDDADFSASYFKPNLAYKPTLLDRIIGRTPEVVYDYLLKKYEIAGQTILAPEESLTDDAYDLFTAYGEKVNRVDPKMIDGKLKPGFKGMNILYISPKMPDWSVDRERVRRATLLADVMQIMFEMGGKSDPYFASVNRIATTTIALLLQLTYPTLKGRQPNLIDVQEHLDDFKRLITPTDHLFPGGAITDKNRKYLWLYDNIRNFFLGAGAETFEQHARGLKVQFSLFLADDYIRNLVAAKEVIDFDEILANNELTVVNIELPEIGPINSPALGLFFSVNMTNAVLRRPGNEWSRSFHVWRIDEFPIVVTPSMEQAFTLFRKFKVAMEVALQTLDQMEKTPYLKYLKSVILNSTANQIVFGRANISEMETYSALSGMFDDYVEMEGITETSLFTENPTMSINTRKTKTKAFINEQSDIRNRDFQEITYFYTRRGSIMQPVHGKVEFIKKKDKKGSLISKKHDWAGLYKKFGYDMIAAAPDVRVYETSGQSESLNALSEVIIREPEAIKSTVTLNIETLLQSRSEEVLELEPSRRVEVEVVEAVKTPVSAPLAPEQLKFEDIEIIEVKSTIDAPIAASSLEMSVTESPKLPSEEKKRTDRTQKFNFYD